MNQRRISVFALIAMVGAFIGCAAGTTGPFWKNVWGTEIVVPQEQILPASAAELVEIIQRAQSQGKRVRMTGSGHSASDVAITSDILLNPQKLSGPLSLDATELKNPAEPYLARVLSGSTIRTLNSYFDLQNLAFPSLGGYDAQTIAGATMTATHGSSLNYGPISSAIASMQVVSYDGKVFQIEPTDGITDPAQFSGVLLEDPSIPVELIQDDETFQAMQVSIGSMGVVYAYVLKLEPKFWITETRVITTWSAMIAAGGFLGRIINGQPLSESGPAPDYYEIQVNPYSTISGGDHTVLLTRRWKSFDPQPVDASRGAPGNEFLSQLLILFQQPVEWILNSHPSMAPAVIDSALNTEKDDRYTNLSYKVFNIGVVNETKVYAIEVAFDLNEIIAGVERQFAIIDELKTNGIIQSSPLAVRFVAESDAHIAMMSGRKTAMMEIINLQGLRGIDEFFQAHQAALFTEFNTRPHWGLDLNYMQGETLPSQLYPRWADWKAIYQSYNRYGTFNGKVTDRLGISVTP